MSLLRWFFFQVLIKLFLAVIVGIHVHHPDRLPQNGPAIITANHNSHLDVFVLITLLPSRLLPRIRPVAAADYFGQSPLKRWFSQNIIDAILLSRKPQKGSDVLAECRTALEDGDILILFPEGSRGAPEEIGRFKAGVARLAENYPEIPVIPVYLQGLGKVLPKGEALLVPFFCDAVVGNPLHGSADRRQFMENLQAATHNLKSEIQVPPWL